MSTKRPRPSFDDEADVRRFIDDVAVEEDGEEDGDDDEEDPDHSESSIIISIRFRLAQSTQHNFLLMMTATPLMNPNTPMIVLLFARTMQRRLPRPCSKLEPLPNVMYLNARLAPPISKLTVSLCIRRRNGICTCIVLTSQ